MRGGDSSDLQTLINDRQDAVIEANQLSSHFLACRQVCRFPNSVELISPVAVPVR